MILKKEWKDENGKVECSKCGARFTPPVVDNTTHICEDCVAAENIKAEIDLKAQTADAIKTV